MEVLVIRGLEVGETQGTVTTLSGQMGHLGTTGTGQDASQMILIDGKTVLTWRM